MTKLHEYFLLAAAIAATVALTAMASSQAFAQQAAGPQPGDPPRWYQPNVTDADRYRTAMKEAGAAQQEALNECRSKAAERDACVREARERYRADVAEANAFAPTKTSYDKAPK